MRSRRLRHLVLEIGTLIMPKHHSRRGRLLDFVDRFAKDDPHRWRPRVGGDRIGHNLFPEDLTTDALEALADRIVREFWGTKKRDRLNRARWAAAGKPAMCVSVQRSF